MTLKLIKKESDKIIDSSPENLNSNELRSYLLRSAQNFKSSWKDLACALNLVWSKKLFKQWGYQNFDEYTNREIGIGNRTALKLIGSYNFLEKEKLEFKRKTEENQGQDIVPSIEAVKILQQAKKSLEESQYETIKEDVIKNEKDFKEIKKDLTNLIRERKENSSDEEKEKNSFLVLKRFIYILNTLKRDIRTLNVLPESFIAEIENLIDQIQSHTKRN